MHMDETAAPKRPRQVNAFVRVNAPGGVYSDKAAFTLASHPFRFLLDFPAVLSKTLCAEGEKMKTLSIAETRRDFCSLASNVIDTGEAIVISRYGRPSLILMKYAPEEVAEKTKTAARPPRCEDTPPVRRA